ncbi:hypothetical protein N7495_009272 [Penicillium taxi]|uniref:uncharacterized protein n=1 Tax=Penicillium taxi TaxID=168475 RepID=UPI002545AEF8|nr:uncharacterized protein N7495_009272 [Penicillium taxi]KAJ5884762.1 hypothetical protein N7495_009272 [Penicillium taxi]
MSEPTSPIFPPAHSLFKRCVSCGSSSPVCPSCPSGQTCTMTAQSCNECATTKCVSTGESSSAPAKSKSETPAIAGGVVGGVAGIALIVFLVYWFLIRKKRQERAAQAEKSSQFTAAREERKSTHSIASTVLTRASNVIQIAYIPGVTNRTPPHSPNTLVPPVPPLPGAHPDQHFFMPGDLRDSTWTTSTAGGHQSFSPTLRSSVATTIYRSDAIVSETPAQQIQRSRANIVSVHSGQSTPSTPTGPVPVLITPRDAPAVPAITPSQLAKADAMTNSGSSIVARTVMAKPVMVRGPSLKKKDEQKKAVAPAAQAETPVSALSSPNSGVFDGQKSAFEGVSSEEDNAPSVVSSNRLSNQTPPPRVQSPFADEHEVKG